MSKTIQEQMTELTFYSDQLAEVEKSIEGCQKRIQHDMMTQMVQSDDCGIPVQNAQLVVELETLQQHRTDLVNHIVALVREVK